MSKTTFTGKGRLGLLLCLTGLLSCTTLTTATSVRAQDDGRPADNTMASPDGTVAQGPDDPRYNNPNGGDPRYNSGDPRNNNDPRYNDNSNGNYAGQSDDPRYANSQANEDGGSPDAQDPPSRVARLSYLDGSVSFQAGGSGDWGNAAKNRPVTIGDKIWVDKDSRAELQAGQASIHLGAMTALSFLNLDQNITQMRLAEGSINFRVRELREGDTYEVDTPNVAFTVRQAGAFRIDVNENGDGTLVTVIRGEGEVTAGGKSHVVRSGELAEFNGTDSDIDYHTDRAPQPDDFDRWAADRDRKEENSVSARYVSRDTVGYSDLDDNGTWSQEPNYGPVWYPNSVAVGWAPYSNGYWGYVGPWGWTWIGYEPWGFAPYHYGRWNYFGGRWGWCPGPIGYYPVYGPAFVGFLGGGFGFGFGVGVGVGWFPLGFGEVYHPWYGYRAGGAYIRNINIHNTYIRNVNNVNFNSVNRNYAYAHNPAAVTATTRAGFVGGQAVNRGATPVTAASLRNAQVTNHLNMTPTRASYTGAANARSGGRVATPPASVQNRAVIARTAPAAAASHMAVRTVGNSGYSGGRNSANAGNRSVGNSTAYGGRASANYGGQSPNRPSYAGSGSVNSQGAARYNPNRPPSANGGAYNTRGGSRSYSAPSSGYSSPSRGYSAPSRTYSAPSHSSPAPSRGSSGGGRPSGGGGGGSRGGSGSHGR
ncbi:MAG TPA: DUF6600 domain-containing protein [Verrucomicrobiae bacterium]|jgi:hypothetical protein|nr:DUF6600 domain-containing protein [Verrucomicrobiae bacterium]